MGPGMGPGQIPGQNGGAEQAPSGTYGGETAGAGLGGSVAVADPNYIDSAIPRSMFRLRFDAFYGDNRPDRAEFFYAQCRCTGVATAKGPPLTESSVNAQTLSAYLELLFPGSERFSIFGELPERFINPDVNANNWGISDVNFGFKYAFLMDDVQIMTLQVRGFAPSGDTFKGLGTDNWAVEPALLYERRLSECWNLFGEVRAFIPIAPQSDFAGNVLRYGLGVSYLAYAGESLRVAPVAEFVGWSILSGKELVVLNAPDNIAFTKNSSGEEIVNAKVGVRFNLGRTDCGGTFLNSSDIALSYGRALTGTFWYKDIYRIEYRLRF
jgi:hypothetical protein